VLEKVVFWLSESVREISAEWDGVAGVLVCVRDSDPVWSSDGDDVL
jgi:hypothetical protein